MQISAFLIRIILLAIPGIITSLIYHKLIRRRAKREWEDILKIFVFALINYSIIYILITLFFKSDFKTYSALFDEKISIPGSEVIYATIVSIPVAFIFSFLSKKRFVNWLGNKTSVTHLISDNDVWEDYLDLWTGKWVFVRDEMRKLIYFGYIDLYSESGKNRELVLRDVDVYDDRYENRNEDYSFLYKLESIYLSRSIDQITIEIPIIEKEKNNAGSK